MRTAFAYLNRVYLSELDLYREEGVTAEEAEPVLLPDDLPETIARVDVVLENGGVFCDLQEAMREFSARSEVESQLIVIGLNREERRYG